MLVAALGLGSCHSSTVPTNAPPAPEGPSVLRFEDGTQDGDPGSAIRIVFDRPVVDVETVGPMLVEPPVTVEPPAPLDVHFDDRTTLVVRASHGWEPRTRYTLRLSKALAALRGPRELVFDFAPPRLGVARPRDFDASRRPQIVLRADADIDRAQVARHCALRDEAGGRAPLHVAPDQALADKRRFPRRSVVLQTPAELPFATRFSVECDDALMPRFGSAPFRVDEDAAHFTTHGRFELREVHPAPGTELAPEEAALRLTFSTPVEVEQLEAHVHISPEPPRRVHWDAPSFDPATGHHHQELGWSLRSGEAYTVSVDAALEDVFGQKLGVPRSYRFRTGDRLPGVWAADGVLSVIERAGGYHVGLLNAPAVALRCARIDMQRLPAVLEPLRDWVHAAMYDQADDAGGDLDALGIAVSDLRVPVAAPRNVGASSPVDLGALCGPAPGAQGLYLVEAGIAARIQRRRGGDGGTARALANLTDLGLVAKRGRGNALVWVTRLSSALPVPGVEVVVLDAQGAVIARGHSDRDGLARFDGLPAPAGETFFVAETADDVAVVGTGDEWRWSRSEGYDPVELDWNPTPARRVFVYSERGVYRPGETVLLQGIWREVPDRGAPAAVVGRELELTLEIRGEPRVSKRVTTSDFGTFHAELPLPAAAEPGRHAIRVMIGGEQAASAAIQVAEYRPATLELRGGPEQSELVTGERAKVALEARYLFGVVVPDAQVIWTVEREQAEVRAPTYREYSFLDLVGPASQHDAPPEHTGFFHGKTDAQGRARQELTVLAVGGPQRYTVSAAVRDKGEARVVSRWELQVDSSERYVGTRWTRRVFTTGQPLRAEVVVVDRAGLAAAGAVELELFSAHWECEEGGWPCRRETVELARRSLSIGPAPTAVELGARDTGGELIVRATVRDDAGRIARSSASTFLVGTEVPAREPAGMVELSIERERYRPGERARVALHTSLRPERYLLTTERSDLLDAKVVDAAEASRSLALGRSAAPSAFIGLVGVTGRAGPGAEARPRIVAGVGQIEVERPSRELTVDVALAAERYRPGERIEGRVAVRHLGKAVAAEVALLVVNESLLSLTDFDNPDPTAVLHRAAGLGVVTVANLTRLVDAGAAAQVPQGPQPFGEGTIGLGGGRGVVLDVEAPARNDHVPVAYWQPALRTDRSGRAAFAFDAPTDLSAYRVMAVAVAKDDRAGSTATRVQVHTELSVRPTVPRFVSRGDSLELGALVHDHTASAGGAAVTFSAEGLTLADSARATHGEAVERVHTQAVVGDADHAWFAVGVRKAGHADSVRRELAVRRPLDTELRVLASGRSRSLEAELRWPAGALPQSELQVTVDRAGLAPLAPLLSRLLDYPFGCTEQTASALAALVAAPELAAAILPESPSGERVRERVAAAQAALLSARHWSGEFGLYPGMPGRAALTALVLDAALSADAAGHAVPELLLDGASEALRRALTRRSVLSRADRGELSWATRAALGFSRQGAPHAELEEALWARRDELGDGERALLLRAWAARGVHADRRAELIAGLARERWLALPRDAFESMAAPASTTGTVLRALVEAGASTQQQARLAAWLTEHALDPAFYWSTRDIPEALAGLSAWARQASAGAGRASISVDGKPLWQGELRGAQVVQLRRSAAELSSGRVRVEGDGELSIAIRREDVAASRPRPAFSRGLSVTRRYLDARSGAPVTAIALGDIVQVVLEARVDDPIAFVALSDPLPAGFEPLDPNLSEGSLPGCRGCNARSSFAHVQHRDDRVEAFAEHLRVGTHQLRYLMRATTAGRFSAPGATMQPMYAPDVFARSAVGQVAVHRRVE